MSEDTIFEEVESKTLKEVLKKEGRSQEWLRLQLIKKGIKRDKTQMSLYSTGKVVPRDEYVIMAIAEILERELTEIKQCFKTTT